MIEFSVYCLTSYDSNNAKPIVLFALFKRVFA